MKRISSHPSFLALSSSKKKQLTRLLSEMKDCVYREAKQGLHSNGESGINWEEYEDHWNQEISKRFQENYTQCWNEEEKSLLL